MTHPSKLLDDSVHQRTRLGILTVLCESGRADFAFLRRTLELTDGNLSRNLTRLQESGYVAIDKLNEGHGTRTWVAVTVQGRAALNAEIKAMRDIIARVESGPSASSAPVRGGALRPREA